jgi:hypothetical protein
MRMSTTVILALHFAFLISCAHVSISEDKILNELSSFRGMTKPQLETLLKEKYRDSVDFFKFEGRRWFSAKSDVFGRHGELTVRLNSNDVVASSTLYVEGDLPAVKDWIESLKRQFDVAKDKDVVTYHARLDKDCLEVTFNRKYRSELLNILTLHYEGCDVHR